MEKLAVYFNADFEASLFYNKKYKSDKFNWEFEYLLFYILDDPYIFTLKNYDQTYIDRIESLTQAKIKFTRKIEEASPWLADSLNLDLKKSLQDKVSLFELLKKNNFLPHDTRIISNQVDLKEGFLYKSGRSSSGMGHFLYPLHEKKISKLLKSEDCLIEEPVRNRTFDFSTLFKDGEILVQYQNFVDRHFQYKGSLIGSDISLSESNQSDLQEQLDFILNKTKDYTGVYSIDSYLYLEGGELKIFPVCEVNMRATMGLVSHLLKNKFFPDYRLTKFVIKNRKGYRIENIENIIELSPADTRFQTYLIAGENVQEIDKYERNL